MKIFIHVGLGKTGTTALQKIFIKTKDLQYFNNMDFHSKINPDLDLLFSNEMLSGHPIPGEYEDRYTALKNLKRIFPDAYIILGIRDPDSWIRSYWKECIIQGGTMTFDQWMDAIDPDYLDFDKYIKTIRKNFPLFVYHFEDLKSDFDGVVRDIYQIMDKEIPFYENKIYRKTITDFQIQIIRLINKTWFKDFFRRFIKNMRNIF